jgi:hypothetical protein
MQLRRTGILFNNQMFHCLGNFPEISKQININMLPAIRGHKVQRLRTVLLVGAY